MADERVWLNGSVVRAAEATVSVFDHGLTVGDGVFETLKAQHGVPFAPRRHLARLRRSAASLGLAVPYDDDQLRAAMAAVLATDDLALARVRITLTGGVSPLGSDRGEGDPTLVVAVAPLAPPAPSTAVCIVRWTRNEQGALAGIKSTSYADNVIALAAAKQQGCTEGVFATTRGTLCEGTGTNVFVAVDGRLVTPPLTSGCLAGVTRELVLEVTDAVEEDVPMEVFLAAQEVFLTSTGRDVQAVSRVGDRVLSAPGPLTTDAAAAFGALAAADRDP
ncbi:MAG: aminotransferase class IV [Acidimicrobiales bacterium]